MSFFSKPEKISAVFDVGNGSIGVALVVFSPGKPATILYTHREPITFLLTPTDESLADSMLKLLKSVSGNTREGGFSHLPKGIFGHHSIHDVYCVFASPWCYPVTSIIKVKKRRPMAITRSLLEEIAANQDLESRDARSGSDSGIVLKAEADPKTIIERKIIHVALNGYDIEQPVGKKALEIEMTAFSSAVSKILLKKTEDAIASSFHFKKIQFFSYALISWMASRDLFPAIADYIFFDVSGEATDVSIIVKGVLEGVESFPMGRASILRAVMETMNVSSDVALSFLTLTLAGGAEASLAARIKEICKKSASAWLSDATDVLKKIQQKYSLPQAAFITVDDDVSALFCDTIKAINSPELSIPHSAFNLVYLNGDVFRTHNNYQTPLVPDPFLSLESIFLAKSLGKDIGKTM